MSCLVIYAVKASRASSSSADKKSNFLVFWDFVIISAIRRGTTQEAYSVDSSFFSSKASSFSYYISSSIASFSLVVLFRAKTQILRNLLSSLNPASTFLSFSPSSFLDKLSLVINCLFLVLTPFALCLSCAIS